MFDFRIENILSFFFVFKINYKNVILILIYFIFLRFSKENNKNKKRIKNNVVFL